MSKSPRKKLAAEKTPSPVSPESGNPTREQHLLTAVAEAQEDVTRAETALNRAMRKDEELRALAAPLQQRIELNRERLYSLSKRDEFQKTGFGAWWSPGLTEEAQAEYDQLVSECLTLCHRVSEITGFPHANSVQGPGFPAGLTSTTDIHGNLVVRTCHSDECRRLADQLKTMRRQLRRAQSFLSAWRKSSAADARRQKIAAEMEILHAKAASVDGTSRELAVNIRKKLEIQDGCPYCGKGLGHNPHADHIYPLSRGGHSILANMVMVCAECNVRKGAMTLRAFIVKYSLNRDMIEKRLLALKKDF